MIQEKKRANPKMTPLCVQFYFSALIFWMIQKSSFFTLPNTTDLLYPSSSPDTRNISIHGVSKFRRKRYIFSREMSALLGYHNQVRAQVSPPAANMEYMVSFFCTCYLRLETAHWHWENINCKLIVWWTAPLRCSGKVLPIPQSFIFKVGQTILVT